MTIRSFRRAHTRRVARERRRLATAGQRALMAGVALGASAAMASSAQAAGKTYVVQTNTDDSGSASNCNVSGQCTTLRDAIVAANADTTQDKITFASTLTGKTITLTNGALTISGTGGLTIDGSAAPGLTISGSTTNPSEIFDITAPSGTPVTLEHLIITKGSSTVSGGAIRNRPSSGSQGSKLVLNDDRVSGSTAQGEGGGIYTTGSLTVIGSTITGNTSVNSFGGGIEALGPPFASPKYLKVINSTIANNHAQGAGGIEALGFATSVTGSHITDNHATGSNNHGGGITAYFGSLSVSNTTVSGNTALGPGGGIAVRTKYGTSITGSTLSGNTAPSGGGIYLAGFQSGPGARTHAGAFGASAAQLAAAAQVAAAPIQAAPKGNPISISRSTISGNTAGSGGGIELAAVPSGNPVTISQSTVSGNKAQASGGSSPPPVGGGLLVDGTVSSAVELIDSTISGNSAGEGGGVSLGGSGTQPLLGTGGSIAFNNSTIASNQASSANGGGGIFLSQYSTGTSPAPASGNATIFSTIVGRNTAAGAENDLAQAPATAASKSGGFKVSYSLIQAPGNANLISQSAVIKGVDPQLGVLANNGGPTQTMLPAYTSPVIDQGKDSPGLKTDQRGDPRTVNNQKSRPAGGDGTDIGAVEVGLIPIAASIKHATHVTTSAATLHGKITTHGEAVTWHFVFGRTSRYGQGTPTMTISAGHGVVTVSFRIKGLRAGKLYHFRLLAVSSVGTKAKSRDGRFRTPNPKAQPKAKARPPFTG